MSSVEGDVPNSKAKSLSQSIAIPYKTYLDNLKLVLLYSSAVARVTTSTTIFPTVAENGGHIIEK